MYECIPCVCGAPGCVILIRAIKSDNSEFLDDRVSDYNYDIIYPVYYEDHILYTGKWHFITKYFRYLKRFFKYIYKIISNDIYLEYDVMLDDENAQKLQEIDPTIIAKKENETSFYTIANKVKVDVSEIPFFVILNFLFKGYMAGEYCKYINNMGMYRPRYSYVVFRIF